MELRGRLVVLSELYRPELTSTGYYVSEIAESLTTKYEVHVLCSQPTYASRGVVAPSVENLNGVRVHRVWSPRGNRTLRARIADMLGFSANVAKVLLSTVKSGDTILAVTNPPLLPFIGAAIATFRGARFVLLIHDVYPELLVSAGVLHRDSFAWRLLNRARAWLYDKAAQVIVLGRDMRDLVTESSPVAPSKVTIIENWADLEEIRVEPRESGSPFVIQHAGNMGRTHDLMILIEAAKAAGQLVRLDFVGDGAQRKKVEEESRFLENVTVAGYRPRDERSNSLGNCDVAVISFQPGMAGVSVPSRMYNVMASGRAIIALCDGRSELARTVDEFQIGWVVPPGDLDALVAVLREAESNRVRTSAKGATARSVAESHYSKRIALNKFLHVLAAGHSQ